MKLWDELVGSLIGYAVAAGIAAAALAAIRVTGGWGRLFLLPRLRPGAWNGRTFLSHFLIFAILPGLIISFFEQLGLARELVHGSSGRLDNLVSPIYFCGFLAISFSLLRNVNGVQLSKVGLGRFRWRPHVVLGAVAFLVGTPVILAISMVAGLTFDTPDLPLKYLKRDDTLTLEWVIFFFRVIVFAPIIEEYLVRGLLMGWLRRTNLLGHAIFVWSVVLLTAISKDGLWEKFGFVAAMGIVYACIVGVLYWPVMTRGLGVFMAGGEGSLIVNHPDFWSANLFEAEGRENRVAPWCDFGPAWTRWKHQNAQLAIFGSAVAFAMAHQWPGTIPLVVFGGLAGWLAYRTQSLIPGIVMHMLFNIVPFVELVMLPGE